MDRAKTGRRMTSTCSGHTCLGDSLEADGDVTVLGLDDEWIAFSLEELP